MGNTSDGVAANVGPSSEPEKREPGDLENYIQKGDGWFCKQCGAKVFSVQVSHPVHIVGLDGGGYGDCKYEEVPYCPNCDKKPNPQGVPVYAHSCVVD